MLALLHSLNVKSAHTVNEQGSRNLSACFTEAKKRVLVKALHPKDEEYGEAQEATVHIASEGTALKAAHKVLVVALVVEWPFIPDDRKQFSACVVNKLSW